MTKIVIYPHYCQIQEDSDNLFLKDLDKELSYFNKNMIFSRAFKFKKWDGVQHLLKGNLIFPSGLFHRVCSFFASKGKIYEVLDLRSPKSPINTIDILPKLTELGKAPFFYQLEMVDIAKQYDHGIFRAATGAGKSIAIALITAYFGKLTNIYVIGTDLLYQLHKLFEQIFNQEIGIVGDGLCQIRTINIVSIWTAGTVLGMKPDEIIESDEDNNKEEKLIDIKKYEDVKKMLSSAKVNIFDECQICSCQTIKIINDNIASEHIYGMSASPNREDGLDLLIEGVLGKIIYNLSATELIKLGYLVKPFIKFIEVPELLEIESSHYKTIYKKYIVENTERNAKVVKACEKLVEQGYTTLLLYNNIAHGQYLYSQLQNKIPCALLSGKDDIEIRNKAKQDLESEKIKAILASSIFDIGLDLPCLSGLVLAGGGRSKIRSIQRVGRILRNFPGKKQVAIIDFIDNAKFLSDHSKARYKIYSSEEEFEVILPPHIKWKKQKIKDN